MHIVEVSNLEKTFGKHQAVKGISFNVKRGEIYGLLGANGAGKTTTIHMMLGLTKPSSGSIRMFGMDLEKHRIDILQRVNFASSYVSLPYNLKVWENLFVFSEIYGVKNSKRKIEELLELFELSHLRNSGSGKLSSGEQTRLNLCKAFLNDPEVLLLDEPTASLDPDLADKARKVMSRLQKEREITIIITSHNMLDVGELCDRIAFMHSGKIITEGSAAAIIERCGSSNLEEAFITMSRNEKSLKQEANLQEITI